MHTSATPRDFSSDSTVSQNFADSPGGGPHPQAQHLLGTVTIDTHRQINRPVGDHPVADLHHDRVDEDHRVDGVQRPRLPLLEFFCDRVGDPGDQVRRHLDVVDLPQVGADVARSHPARIQRDDPLVEPLQPGLALAHDLRLEAAGPVPRHGQIDGTNISQQRLAGRPVAAVPRPPPSRVMLFIAQVPSQLLSQRPLQHRLSHLRQQAGGAEQLGAFGLGLGQQLIRQILIHQRPPLRRLAISLAGHHRSVCHHASFREPHFLRLIVRPRHLHSR
jgi:hypothetical protein